MRQFRTLLLATILFGLSAVSAWAGEVVTTGNLPPNWKQAVVRIASHGLSGTIIETRLNYTLVLSSAHGWVENGDRTRQKVVVDVPFAEGQTSPKANGSPRLVAIDKALDLALVEIPAGPFPAVIPVAKAGTLIGPDVRSAGYDEMKWQDGPLIRNATVSHTDGTTIYTKEIPWHGRSGGVLLDQSSGSLIGVVQGYQTTPTIDSRTGQRVQSPTGPGMYVSAVKVRGFLVRVGLNEYAQQGKISPIRYGEPDPRDDRARGGLSPGIAPPPPGKIRMEESPWNLDCPNGQCPKPQGFSQPFSPGPPQRH